MCINVFDRGLDVTAITSSMIGGTKNARACQAVAAMMSKGSINPADVTILYTAYTSPDPPPVDMIRNPCLLSESNTISTSKTVCKNSNIEINFMHICVEIIF